MTSLLNKLQQENLKDDKDFQKMGKQRLIQAWNEACDMKEIFLLGIDVCAACSEANRRIAIFFLDEKKIGKDTITLEQIEKFLKAAPDGKDVDAVIKKLVQYKINSKNSDFDFVELLSNIYYYPIQQDRLFDIIRHNPNDFYAAYFKQILSKHWNVPMTKFIIQKIKLLPLNETNKKNLNKAIAMDDRLDKNETNTYSCLQM